MVYVRVVPACVLSRSVMSDSATPWTVARQAPSVRGSSQASILEWVAIFSSPRDLSNPRIEPVAPATSLYCRPNSEPPGKPVCKG